MSRPGGCPWWSFTPKKNDKEMRLVHDGIVSGNITFDSTESEATTPAYYDDEYDDDDYLHAEDMEFLQNMNG